jgi:hypothetical protein
MPHHQASVINNQNITMALIRLNKRLQYSNSISYLQAYYTKKALLCKLDSNKAKNFAKFLAFCQRVVTVCKGNYIKTA